MTTSSFSVAILAGGLATRLHPFTKTIPKSMIEINALPFIAHQLKLLQSQGITQVVICTGHLGNQIQDYVGDGKIFNLHVEYSHDGSPPLGTAGAIKKALPLLSSCFFVLYGDTYFQCNLGALQHRFLNCQKPALMTLFKNKNQFDKSNVHYDGTHLLAYDKKNPTPTMEHIDYGIGIFKKEIFDEIPEGMPYDLAIHYQSLLKSNQLAGIELPQRFYEIGSLEGLKEFQQFTSRARKQAVDELKI